MAEQSGLTSEEIQHDLAQSDSAAATPKKKNRKTVTFGDSSEVVSLKGWSIVSVILVFGGWFLLTYTFNMPEEFKVDGISDRDRITNCNKDDACKGTYSLVVGQNIFPSVRDTWNAFFELLDVGYRNVSLWGNTWASLSRVLRGLGLGIFVGVPVGMAMGLSSRARGFFDPIVELLRPIPPLALIGLFTLFFGLGDSSAWKLLTFASIFIMIISARSGVQTANLSKVRAAYSLGASKRQVLQKVLLPNALPELFTGIRVSLGVAWGTLVAAELSGVNDGLGAMIAAARKFNRFDVTVVGIVIIAVLGVLMDWILRWAEGKLIPWRGKG